MRKKDVVAIVDRLKGLYDVHSDSDLAKVLETTPQTVASWKSRGSVPYAICVKESLERDLSLDWLVLGIGYPNRSKEKLFGVKERFYHPVYGSVASEEQKKILSLLNSLPDDVQNDLLEQAKIKSRVHELEKTIDEMQREVDQLIADKNLNND